MVEYASELRHLDSTLLFACTLTLFEKGYVGSFIHLHSIFRYFKLRIRFLIEMNLEHIVSWFLMFSDLVSFEILFVELCTCIPEQVDKVNTWLLSDFVHSWNVVQLNLFKLALFVLLAFNAWLGDQVLTLVSLSSVLFEARLALEVLRDVFVVRYDII